MLWGAVEGGLGGLRAWGKLGFLHGSRFKDVGFKAKGIESFRPGAQTSRNKIAAPHTGGNIYY